MREILFRGFHPCENGTESAWIDGKEIKGFWKIGSLCIHPRDKKYQIFAFDEKKNWYLFFDVIPETVGQYTGLTDKNGTRVFENDVILFHWGEDNTPIIFEIKYVDGEYQAVPQTESVDVWRIRIKGYSHEFEVLGSIHSNHDILDGKENDNG